jgi:hypothetical protein
MKILTWIIDTCYLIKGKLLTLKNLDIPAIYTQGEKTQKAHIVLLPGIHGTWKSLNALAMFIAIRGWTIITIPELGNNTVDVPIGAKIVSDSITKKGLKNIIFIGNSKGALIGKYILQNYNADSNILGMAALSGVFMGTPWANFIPFKAYYELRPSGRIINEMKSYTDVNKKIVSIYPKYDNYLPFPNSSRLPGALDNIEVPVRGHNAFIFKPLVWEEVEKAIEKISQN